MATLKDYYIKGFVDGAKDSGVENFRDLIRNADANTVMPQIDKSIPSFDDLNEFEQQFIILVGSNSQTSFEGSKSKGSKKNKLKSAGWSLESKGLVKTRQRYGGYEAELTEAGKEMFDTLSSSQINSVVRQSEAQRERQAERVNGQYSEMNTCDYCGKRGSNMYSDNIGGIICQNCIDKGLGSEE